MICAERRGSKAGYLRHWKAGEDACADCLAGSATEERERRHKRGLHAPRKPAKCGTNSGYIRHVKRREAKCRPCRRAHREYMQKWRNGGYLGRTTVALCIVDVLTTFDCWMTQENLADHVLRLHPEWSARSVYRVALRLFDEGVLERRQFSWSSYVEFRADESAWELVA